MKTTSTSVQRLTKLALLLAIELAMRAIGLGAVPVGPLNMSFLTLPIAIDGDFFQHQPCTHGYPVRGHADAHGSLLRLCV